MKVYSKITSIRRASSADPATYLVEYVLLTGEKRSDQISLSPGAYSNEAMLVHKLKQQLRVHLNATYAPDTFHIADIALFGS